MKIRVNERTLNAIKNHFIGICILTSVLSTVAIPIVAYMYYNGETFFSKIKRNYLTRREFEEIFSDAEEILQRGFYEEAYKKLRKAGDKVLHRAFAASALIEIADLFYKTEITEEQIKYKDALFFYGLAETQRITPEQKMWMAFQKANCQKNLKLFLPASEGYEDFIKKYPAAPCIMDAKISLAELLVKREKATEAKKILQEIMDNTESENELSSAVFFLAQVYLKEAEQIKVVKMK